MFENKYPYTDFNEYNLDWVIVRIKQLTDEWVSYKTQMDADWLEMRNDWSSMKEDLEELKTFITTYFDNLDVQEEINNKLDQMAEDGSLLAVIKDTVESKTATTTTAWLTEHITEPEGVVIDTSLTVAGACADAKATGDRISDVNNALDDERITRLNTDGLILDRINELNYDRKVNVPLSNDLPDYGTNGQILRTNGDGTTSWTNSSSPTDSQVESAVVDWLNGHPDATTTVQNGSITNAKMYPGSGKVNLQSVSSGTSENANAAGSFIAGGAHNGINNYTEMGKSARYGHAEGYSNRVHDWYGHAEGSGCIVDSKIGHVEGNGCICSTNDGHCEGNQSVAGRRYYPNVTTGAEDARDSLGILNFVLIPDVEGDVTSFFPNALIDNLTSRYGAGAQKDSVGNIYASGFTPAIWNGDTLVTPNDLMWAMHRICILRGAGENDIAYVTIAKCVYTSGVGTKVYYFGDNPTTGTKGIYSSYSPQLLGGGNGSHAEGNYTSAWGYGSHSEGRDTRAWNYGAHAEGFKSSAIGEASHAEGNQSKALYNYAHAEGFLCEASNGFGAHAEGYECKAQNQGAHAEGSNNVASGYASHAEGQENTASGQASHVQGRYNNAYGDYSSAEGVYAKALRSYQKAFAVGQISEIGDRQYCELITSVTKSGVGWHNIDLMDQVENGKAYNLDIDVIARQSDGTAGTIGDTFAYNIKALIVVDSSGNGTVLGTPIRTLIGRSAGMSGDGLTTGARVSLYNGIYPPKTFILRYDGVEDTTFRFFCHTKWMEMKL